MTAILSLLAAAALALYGGGGAWLVAAAVVAAVAGTTFPDLDQLLPIGHRSALTHGVLPVVALAAYDRRLWPVAAGLGLGLGLHLAADLFPNGMRGYATIKLPLLGSIGAGPSYLWIATNAALCLGGGAWMLGHVASRQVAGATLAAVGVYGVAYLLRTDGGWWALAMFAGLGWLALR
ncbi:MAG TPA: hypothetical protein VF636_10625 [Sphingomonas sp.]